MLVVAATRHRLASSPSSWLFSMTSVKAESSAATSRATSQSAEDPADADLLAMARSLDASEQSSDHGDNADTQTKADRPQASTNGHVSSGRGRKKQTEEEKEDARRRKQQQQEEEEDSEVREAGLRQSLDTKC